MAPTDDLAAFTAHCREQHAEDLSRRAVQLRIVEPLLELLGWDLRGDEVQPDVELGGWDVDYLLCVDGAPTVAVSAAAPDAALSDGPVSRVTDALGTTGVNWAVVTDGRTFVLLARTDGACHRRIVDLDDLVEETSALEQYSRAAALARAESRESDREAAARRLHERRDAAIRSVVEALVDVSGDALEDPARDAAAALVDELSIAEGGATGGASPETPSASPASRTTRSSSGATGHVEPRDDPPSVNEATGSPGESGTTDPPSESEATDPPSASEPTDAPTESEAEGRRDDTSSSDTDPATSPPAGSADGEFVVRFFGENASVGAVGADTPGGALAGAVEYLSEHHGLARSVTLPWGGGDDRSLLARDGAHPDGRPMEPRREVAGGVSVWTGVDVEVAKEGIEGLAEAVGLRAMFQGDW